MDKNKILVVEDEAITAQDIAESLTNLGYEVVGTISNGEEALQMAEQHRPDLALMDIVLKGRSNGTSTALKLRDLFGIPVIFLSAYSDANPLQQAQKAEPLGYLTKPFNENDLRITVEMALFKAKFEKERVDLIQKLQEALNKVKTLSGLIPICASCKKIRDDQGYWQAVESYICSRSEASFSHSLCPNCLCRLYPDIYPSDNAASKDRESAI